MASKKKSLAGNNRGFGVKSLTNGLRQAEALIVREQWSEAREILEELSKTYPRRDVLNYLAETCYELGDMAGYGHACERLLEINPNDSDIGFALAGAYLNNLHPILALQTFRQALNRWPDAEPAAEARKLVVELEANVDKLLEEMKLTGEGGMELAVLHERGQAYLAQHEYQKAREAEEELLRHRPDFASARNNLSLISFAEGDLEGAIAISQQVLESQPDNIHALSNLTRFYCLNGQREKASAVAEKLKASQAVVAWDIWTKKVEALSYLGDGEGVLEIFKQSRQVRENKPANPMFYHLVAAAMARQGQMKEARQQWQQALQRSPEFALARDNLDDLDRAVNDRHGPWAFSLGYWVTRSVVEELGAIARSTAKCKGETQLMKGIEGYLSKHPALVRLVPVLLERGDPQGREFAVRLASIAKTPEMLAALKDFALGQWGPDGMRNEAATKVSEAGLLPTEGLRMWLQGKWQEIHLINYEFHGDPPTKHSRQVSQWFGQAILLLRQKDAKETERAEQLIKKALAVEPDAPDLLNNLAGAYEVQGRQEEALALMFDIADRFPDYVFARVSVARLHLLAGETEAAEALLKPLLSRKRFHFDEFAAFCSAYIELLVAQKNRDAARGWLNMWEGIDPDRPEIMEWRIRLEGGNILKKVSKLSKWGLSK